MHQPVRKGLAVAGLLAAAAVANAKPIADGSAPSFAGTGPETQIDWPSSGQSVIAGVGPELSARSPLDRRLYSRHAAPAAGSGTTLVALYPAEDLSIVGGPVGSTGDASPASGSVVGSGGTVRGRADRYGPNTLAAPGDDLIATSGAVWGNATSLPNASSPIAVESSVHPGGGILAGLSEPEALLLLTMLFAAAGFGLRSMLHHR